MSTRLILIRHGQTDWNLQKRYCGFTDIGLNENGKKQIKKLSKRLSKETIHRVYSSDMKRALQSAKIVFKDMPVEKLSELREMNFGIFEGLRYQEIMNKYSKIYRKWIDDPLNVAIPNGESLNNLAKRVRKVLAKILSGNKNRTVVIFTHAGPIRVILCDILRLDLKEIWQIKPASESVNIIEFTKGKGRIRLINDTSHLNG
ncbi:MAG: alpha-ribazole phosphatase [Candidatus Omnitrophica bacterium]|nr:alpha-ribazole phosphatase [Candidatus Omnitrophota bacterium]